MNTNGTKLCDVVQPPTMSIPQHTVDLPKVALYERHRIESSSAREGLPYQTKSSLLPQTENTNNRYSTGSVTPKRFTSFHSITRFRPTDDSLRFMEMSCPEDALHQEATVFESLRFEQIGSLKGGDSSNHQSPKIVLPNEKNCFSPHKICSDRSKLPANLDKRSEARPEHENNYMSSNCMSTIDDERERISIDVVPDRRSSLRNQHLSADELQLRRSSLTPAQIEHGTYSLFPTDPCLKTKEICDSCVPTDLDDDVEKRISQLETLKKQRNSDCAYDSIKDRFLYQKSPAQRMSSQTVIVAEDKDRINRAYEYLRLPNTRPEPSKGLRKTFTGVNGIPDMINSINKLSESTETTCDMFSLEKAMGAIEDTPNLSLDIIQFGIANAENERLLISKRNSIRRHFRSQQRQDRERKKSFTTGSSRSKSPRLSKRVSHLTMESLNALTRKPQHQHTDKDIDQNIKLFLAAQRLSQVVRHPTSGRKISFAEVGDPKGHAVLCCVGMGLTRFATVFYDDLARTLRLRLITPDRPGIGDSEKHQDDNGIPLKWSEDVLAICSHLRIDKFSILAHSAGAIYALAIALCVPEYVKGRIHLLAPWITPSQMTEAGTSIRTSTVGQLPRSQRILRALPVRLLKVANAGFMSATSSSVTRATSDSAQLLRSQDSVGSTIKSSEHNAPSVDMEGNRRNNVLRMDCISLHDCNRSSPTSVDLSTVRNDKAEMNYEDFSGNRQSQFDMRLTLAIWDAATNNANPAVDLLVCLERYRTIGFRYTDVDLPVIIHHGSHDTRVPVENAKWLGRIMRDCETRIIGDEGHGLMANAAIMGDVLTDVAKESQNQSFS